MDPKKAKSDSVDTDNAWMWAQCYYRSELTGERCSYTHPWASEVSKHYHTHIPKDSKTGTWKKNTFEIKNVLWFVKSKDGTMLFQGTVGQARTLKCHIPRDKNESEPDARERLLPSDLPEYHRLAANPAAENSDSGRTSLVVPRPGLLMIPQFGSGQQAPASNSWPAQLNRPYGSTSYSSASYGSASYSSASYGSASYGSASYGSTSYDSTSFNIPIDSGLADGNLPNDSYGLTSNEMPIEPHVTNGSARNSPYGSNSYDSKSYDSTSFDIPIDLGVADGNLPNDSYGLTSNEMPIDPHVTDGSARNRPYGSNSYGLTSYGSNFYGSNSYDSTSFDIPIDLGVADGNLPNDPYGLTSNEIPIDPQLTDGSLLNPAIGRVAINMDPATAAATFEEIPDQHLVHGVNNMHPPTAGPTIIRHGDFNRNTNLSFPMARPTITRRGDRNRSCSIVEPVEQETDEQGAGNDVFDERGKTSTPTSKPKVANNQK